MTRRNRYLAALAALYAILWTALAISPLSRHDWMLENALVVVAVIILASTYRVLPLSRISYTLIFVFMCLHTLGSHYTYALVPYREWISALTGAPLAEGRNHFDRMVHFSYGLLLAYPIREMFLRVAAVKGFWGYFLPLDLTMSTSMLYELIEWAAAEIFGGNLGVAFLGTQGDVWDAQKDMALASLGALIAMMLTAAINIYLQRDFAQEWAESLRVKRRRPLGERELSRLWRMRRGRDG
jgi:putative membrane protein